MNTRSTPINQIIPQQNAQANSFINDQQRQIVMNAQNAINTMQMPQNTQQPLDVSSLDDDQTIQDVLNQIHTENGATSQSEVHSKLPVMPPQLLTSHVTPQMIPTPVVQATPQVLPSQHDFNQMTNHFNTSMSQPQQMYIDPLQNHDESSIFNLMSSVAEDLKIAGLIFILFVIVHFIPVDKLFMKYFALDRIPYYDIILKALMAFIVVIMFRKVFAKF
jgi:hypothetical protein